MNNGRRWSEEVKKKAIKLRLNGSSYGDIQKMVGKIAKSTLGLWFKDLPKPKHDYYVNRSRWMEHIRKLSAVAKKKSREEKVNLVVSKVKCEVGKWSFLNNRDNQKSLLSMLYWAEGQKLPEKTSPVKFVNTDPRLVLLFLTLLRNCYKIEERKLRVRIFVHWYHNLKLIQSFWSKLLNVDVSRFRKSYIKKRGKRGYKRNFMGICFVTYGSVYLRQEIVHTGYNIQEAITGKIPYSRS